ncbi:hypothetical protein EZV62_011109 [Acer yangbiense]|uniref:Protein kinase domain-containing protein n=1 Tax=Acer yangbiense TaxID=1000413 RepID=A0A5C7I4R9_9ROSI|nr:hypothetical protein EZV62_011109 [Acer yangbiense]
MVAVWMWILVFLAGAVMGYHFGVVFFVLFMFLKLIRGGGRDSGLKIFSSLIKKDEDLAFLKKEDCFASLEMIGSGGCGQVFKAELPGSNGKMIAIKKIVLTVENSKQMKMKMKQIQSEINTVGHLRHKNILPLLAHLSMPNCHILVYELMKNGSLHDVLSEASRGTRELDWLARRKIAIGVAAGLEYIHKNNSPRIIHRDLKPANVLLDDDMEAKITDFGLAKEMPDANTHIIASDTAGTFGYIAPEFSKGMILSEKSDIFSFGVLLAAMVIGKFPSSDFFKETEERNMIRWMRNVMISENPRKAIDPKLMGNEFEEDMLLVLKIACHCTQDDPEKRPDSKVVRCMFDQINHRV